MQDYLKKTIGAKIFAIAIGLVLLMAAATAISAFHLNRVNDQLHLVSDFYLPLDQHLGEVRAYALNEIILFDRLAGEHPKSLPVDALAQARQFLTEVDGCAKNSRAELRRKAGERYADEVQRQDVQFELMALCGEEELAQAIAQVEQGLVFPAVQADAQQQLRFAELQQRLAAIPEARGNLHLSLQHYFRELVEGDRHSVRLVRQQVDQDWEQLAKQINEVTLLRLHPYTREVAAHAAELERRALRFNLGITVLASLFGLFFAAWLTRNLVKPVRQLLSGTRAIESGDLDIHIQVSSADEIAALAESFNHMAQELRQKELITETFGKYVDPRIVQGLIADKKFSQQGEQRVMTVFFCDLEGFTSISERFGAASVVKLLNEYFTLMSQPIRHSNGIIDKYIGDAIMAFWGPPFTPAADHPRLACLAALEQLHLLKQFELLLPTLLGEGELPRLNMRIGISSGEVIVGSVGSEIAKSYTVIGDNVNLASRLESVNKHYGTRILICGEVWEQVRTDIECREIDLIRVAGKAQAIRIFEVLSKAGELDSLRGALRTCFESGLAAYRARRWDEAQQAFEQCLAWDSRDQAAAVLLSRVVVFRAVPPAPEWEGVWVFAEK